VVSTESVTRKSGSFLRALFLVVAVLALLVVLGLAYRRHLKHTAEALLTDVKALRIGQSDFADAMRIAQKYQRFRVEGNASVPASPEPAENVFPAKTCTSERCFFEFIIGNRPLSTLHLAHEASFNAVFAVLHGKVEYVQVHLIGGPDPGVNGAIVEEIGTRTDQQPTYGFRNPIGSPYLGVILTPSAPTAVRDSAFDMNMNCLIASTNCDKPCDYLPLAWSDWKSEMDRQGWLDSLRAAYPNCP
jgi:hypothetical protein